MWQPADIYLRAVNVVLLFTEWIVWVFKHTSGSLHKAISKRLKILLALTFQLLIEKSAWESEIKGDWCHTKLLGTTTFTPFSHIIFFLVPIMYLSVSFTIMYHCLQVKLAVFVVLHAFSSVPSYMPCNVLLRFQRIHMWHGVRGHQFEPFL